MSVIPVFISFISVAVRPSHNMRIRMKSPHRPGISPMVFFCGPLPVVSFLRSSFAVLFLWFPFCGLLLRSFSCGFLSALSLLRPTRAHIRQSCNGSVHATIDIRFLWLLIVHPQQSTFCGSSPFQVCAFSTDLAHPSPPEAALWPATVPGLHLFDRPGTPTPRRAASVACHRSRSAPFRQTWHTRPRQRPLCGLPPFQICAFSTDLEHPSLSEAALWPATVPGLRFFDRPGTDEDINMKRLLRYLSCRTYILFTPRHNK